MKMPNYFISQAFRGVAFPKDFLETRGSISFVTDWPELEKEHLVFKVEDDDFFFGLGFKDSCIVFERNNTRSVVTTNDLPKTGRCRIIAMWSLNELIIICGWQDQRKEIRVKTEPVAPPQSLINWARKQNLLPIVEYESKENFRSKVYSCLDSIQDKINESSSIDAFWNFEYQGSKIISRLPKKETHIHSLIHCILSDQLLMSSIDIIPEYKTGVGNLDFMFVGSVKDKGLCQLCAEFKNAHSSDIFHGLEQQLPSYMENKKVEYGAYCVLSYKGDWFNQPNIELKQIQDDLDFLRLDSQYKNRIRIFWLDLSKPKTASKTNFQ